MPEDKENPGVLVPGGKALTGFRGVLGSYKCRWPILGNPLHDCVLESNFSAVSEPPEIIIWVRDFKICFLSFLLEYGGLRVYTQKLIYRD